ncbi:MAG TPA: thioredoxin domain-containing protein, partial [Longimicrobiaceae bacterium]
MTHGLARRTHFASTLAAGALALLTAVTACAQGGGGNTATAASARGIPPLDSVLARASNGRQKGSASARVTIIEVSDFQCPYCRMFFDSTYR